MKNRFGFTLAEVLITLGIIGVVAAMTIPTLMNNTSNVEFRTGFKKIISTLNQAITMNIALDNTDFEGLTASGTGTGSVYEMFTNRMHIVKTTAAADTAAGGLDNGAAAPVSGGSNYALYFNDGMVLGFKTAATGCNQAKAAAAGSVCEAIVDVNGLKKPNRLAICAAASSSVASEPTGTACSSTTFFIGDRFSVRFQGSEVVPNGNAARYVMYSN